MNEQEKMEKVIRSLETAVKNFERYSGDEYGREYDYARVEVETLEDALALLKAQEPVEPKHEDDRPISPLRCGNCGAFILVTNDYKAKYCFECGRDVKWNDKGRCD